MVCLQPFIDVKPLALLEPVVVVQYFGGSSNSRMGHGLGQGKIRRKITLDISSPLQYIVPLKGAREMVYIERPYQIFGGVEVFEHDLQLLDDAHQTLRQQLTAENRAAPDDRINGQIFIAQALFHRGVSQPAFSPGRIALRSSPDGRMGYTAENHRWCFYRWQRDTRDFYAASMLEMNEGIRWERSMKLLGRQREQSESMMRG